MSLFSKNTQPIKGGVLLSELLKIKEHRCECCGLSEWNHMPITLHAHHIDGDKTNNELNNLSLLCPNCHSQTDNFGSKNIKKTPVSDEQLIRALQEQPSIRQALLVVGLSDGSANYKRAKALLARPDVVLPEKEHIYKTCQNCGKVIVDNSTSLLCRDCYAKVSRKVERPSREELKQLIRSTPFTQIGSMFGVTDNAIRKWCDVYNLPRKAREIKLYTDEEWALI